MIKLFFSVLTTLLVLTTHAQDQAKLEAQLLEQYKKIGHWHDFKAPSSKINITDSLQAANNRFKKLLLNYASKYPGSIEWKLKQLQDASLKIASSLDGQLRIYSWDTWTGGTMHRFENVYQAKTTRGTISGSISPITKQDPGFFYSDIYLVAAAGRSFYLAVHHGVYSSRDSYQAIKALAIESSKLNENFAIIKTKSGLKNRLGFDFDFQSVIDRPERPVKLINYDTKFKRISIPVVTAEGTVTSKQINYDYTGRYFELSKK